MIRRVEPPLAGVYKIQVGLHVGSFVSRLRARRILLRSKHLTQLARQMGKGSFMLSGV